MPKQPKQCRHQQAVRPQEQWQEDHTATPLRAGAAASRPREERGARLQGRRGQSLSTYLTWVVRPTGMVCMGLNI